MCFDETCQIAKYCPLENRAKDTKVGIVEDGLQIF